MRSSILKYQSKDSIERLTRFAEIYLTNKKYKTDLYWWAKAAADAELNTRDKIVAQQLEDEERLAELLPKPKEQLNIPPGALVMRIKIEKIDDKEILSQQEKGRL